MATLAVDISVEKTTNRSGQPLHGVIVALSISAPFWAVALALYAGMFS